MIYRIWDYDTLEEGSYSWLHRHWPYDQAHQRIKDAHIPIEDPKRHEVPALTILKTWHMNYTARIDHKRKLKSISYIYIYIIHFILFVIWIGEEKYFNFSYILVNKRVFIEKWGSSSEQKVLQEILLVDMKCKPSL